MSIRNLLFKRSSPDSDVNASSRDNAARIAISEDRKIVFASDSFYHLSHMEHGKQHSADFSSILNFTDSPQTFESLKTGIHKVRINGHAEIFDFHFDWLTTPDNKRYLIGSQALEKQSPPSKTTIQEIASQIKDIQKTAAINDQDLNNFLNMSKDAMVVINEQNKIMRGNTSFTEIFGIESNNKDFVDLFAANDKLYVRNTLRTPAFNDAQKHEQIIDFEARVQTGNGEIHWMQWRLFQKGNHIYCTGRDITDIKTHEKALIRREKQLIEAESIGRMGHWHWTIGEDEVSWSDEIYRIFGADPDTFEPTLQSMNAVIHREDIGRVNQAFERAIIENNNYDMEFRVKRPDGETRYIRCEGRCALDDDNEVIALYGIMQDMTERILYERDLKDAKDAAERAYAAKTQFLANMSHELRTPLNAIIGFSEMMQRQLLGPIGTEKYLEYVSGIRESGEHLLDLISDILDMSKIEAGKYELTLEKVKLAKTIKMAVSMIAGRAQESGVKIVTGQIQNESLNIVADRRAIMQIMLNLLSNAVKFTEEGGEIVVECHERENYIALKVIDNGIGIPANKLAQITRPFEQVSASYTREHEGSGLGLAITKELTEMHGGTLHIESGVDMGTTVTVRLPYDAFKATKKNQKN